MSTRSATKPPELASIERTRWRIDPARSSIEFRTLTFWGLMMGKGRFHRYESTLDLEDDPAIELKIEAATLDTNSKKRDAHLRSVDFFDAENHSQVRFVSESAMLSGEHLKSRGRLYAAGQSMPLDLAATVQRVDGELQVDSTAYVDYYALGMSHGRLGMIQPPAELIVRARLVQCADREIETSPR
jgi:polyisoprenoid-binding protein YceI